MSSTSDSALELSSQQAEAGQQEADALWQLTFLNLLLVMFGVFILIYALQQVKPKQAAKAVDPALQRARELVETERRRAQALRQKLAEIFRKSGLPGTVVDLHQGQPRIVLSSGVVFDTGRAELTPQARRRLQQVARLLEPMGKQLMIEGHTDDRPIHTSRFPSNWELSTARALAVVRLFADGGIPPGRMKLVGYAEHQPRRPNDSEENRRINRRIEIKVR